MLMATLLFLAGCANVSPPQSPGGTGQARALPPSNEAPPARLPFAPPVSPRLPATLAPFEIAAGPDGNIWFTEFRANRIGSITPSGEISSFELGGGGFPERLSGGPDDAIWFTDPAGNRLGRLGMDGATAYVLLPTPQSGPAGITLGTDGNLWFTEHAANRVGRVTPLGTVTEFVLPHKGSPAGIVEGTDGEFYIAENGGNRIDRISMDGRVVEFPLPTPVRRPNDLTVTQDGSIWFTEIATDRIGRLTSGEVAEYELPVRGRPLGITAGPDGNVWVTVPHAHAVCKVARDGRAEAFFLPDRTRPGFIATGADGNLWFTEPDGMIGRVTPAGALVEFSARPSENARDESRAPELVRRLLIAP